MALRRRQQLLFDPRLQFFFFHLQQVHSQLSTLGRHTGAGLPVAHYGPSKLKLEMEGIQQKIPS
jgi:hypothetical protein